MRKVIVKRFPSLLEAKLAESCLEAAGLPALVDNETHGAMIPHYSDALGGFSVSVDEENEATALELLHETAQPEEGAIPKTEVTSPEKEALRLLRRGAYGAVLSVALLPGLGSLFALYSFFTAYKKDRAVFGKHPLLTALGLLFVLGGFLVIATIWLVYAGTKALQEMG